MPSEMLSGPDLGAGYLHQLSVDRDGERTTFTYHAQEGGADAAGPPKGPLDVFGYVRPSQPCQFGGPRCWHRRFLLAFSETMRVRTAYNRSRFVLQTMLDQAYAQAPVAAEAAVGEVGGRLVRDGVPFYVGGEAGAALLGAPLPVREVHLGTHRAGVDRIGALVQEYLIEPVGPTDWPGAGIVHGARAFVGTFHAGSRVVWGVPLDPGAPDVPGASAPGVTRTLPVRCGTVTVPVARPEYLLVRAWVRGPPSLVAPVVALVQQVGPDRALLAELLAATSLSAATRAERLRTVEV